MSEVQEDVDAFIKLFCDNDVAHTGIAMGTPGDKASVGEVVKTAPPAPGQRDRPQPPAPDCRPPPLPPDPPPGGPNAGMGVVDRPPTQVHQAFAVGTGLSHIDDYYSQTKYYDYQHPAYANPSKQKTTFPSTVPDPGQGPSGLQTPKTKTTVATTKPKRPKKPAEEPVATPTLVGKEHKCRDCHKGYATPEKLAKHQQTHTGSSSPFKCDNCKKLFTSKFKLVRHALIHSDQKPFSCMVCDRTFHRKDHLKNHIKVHSPSKEVHVCNSCKKQYTSLLSYRKHQAFHSAEEGNLTCQMCSEDFETKEAILYHLKIHAGSRTVKNPNEKKFTCDQCDRKFFTKKDVRRHLVVHTGKRDFLCQYCPQRFGRKDHLVRHIKKAHHIRYRPDETATAATIKTEVGAEAVKTEMSESSLSNAATEDFAADLDFPLKNISEETLTTLLEVENLGLGLPAASEEGELEDLGNTILEEIEGPTEATRIMLSDNLDASQDVLDEVVLNDPELLQRLLEAPADKNLPLPGFSQTFQSPPPGGGQPL
ncbi:unnamed protein product [Phaedon cochleariae]|uniref:C2H2-type domain-containing protein n=1 Tax=Phaedon cochleariae TaxID=80249 RepID=A0A9P0GPM0_PHACE|nr:unnamed protein product [Phaedon cochleariae]